MLRRHLGNFQQTNLTIIVNDRTTLDIGLRLVGQLHQELSLALDKVLQDTQINIGTQVIDVGDEDMLLASRDELVEQSRVLEGIEDITVAGRVPLTLVASRGAWDGQVALAADTGVTRLVESEDLDVVVRVFLDDALGIVVGVEGVHEDEWDVDFVFRVEMLFSLFRTRWIGVRI